MPKTLKWDDSTNWYLITAGLICMILPGVLLMFPIEVNTQRVFGFLLLFIIGLGLAVAGSPNPVGDDDADTMS